MTQTEAQQEQNRKVRRMTVLLALLAMAFYGTFILLTALGKN